MTKEKLALAVIERLKQEYPDADCTLDYDQAWKLLVSVRLAAQCTDARVNVVVEDLYAKYPDIDALANATPEEIEEIVRPCGLGKSKARDINSLQSCTASGSCMTARIRRRWRWHSGKLCRRKKEARSATGLWSTDARSVLRGRHRTVNGVCSRISVRRTV